MPLAYSLPLALQRLLARLQAEIAQQMSALESGGDPEAWQREIERALARYSTAALMTGQGSVELTPQAVAVLARDVQAQLGYLDNFRLIIQSGEQWQAGYDNRASMYADSIKVPYWRGATRMLPLPAMPAEGTQCLTRCKCRWNVVTVDEAAGDYDAYWLRGAKDSCRTCVQRAADWNPIRIRGGMLA